MERLDKILSGNGFGTRKEVKQLIRYGHVKVDGETVKNPDIKTDPVNSVITVNNKLLTYRKFIYLMMNKPQGYVSAAEDNLYPTVTDLVPEEFKCYSVFPAGRLDVDTEGFIILTNDGKFAHNITSPKKHIPKKYFVITKREITQNDKDMFESGMNLGDFTAMPAKIEEYENGCLTTIYEGKFHQIKRMFEKTGNKVEYLKRVKIGGLSLDAKLKLGEVRELTKGEIEQIWT
ncbi:MAG: rRNA pseudouridine synthase [Clostridia bacterium]|nr:rRNA pseudouridine synthase [Clostridia bacterium]